jgi:hypothetical protein
MVVALEAIVESFSGIGSNILSFHLPSAHGHGFDPHGRRQLTRVNSTNVQDEGLRIEGIGRRMNSKVKVSQTRCAVNLA